MYKRCACFVVEDCTSLY